MRRFPIVGKSFLSRYRHDAESPINSTITIRNVLTCDINQDPTEPALDEVHLLFGFKVEDKNVHFSSGEEATGVTYLTIDLEVESIDIELRDATKTTPT